MSILEGRKLQGRFLVILLELAFLSLPMALGGAKTYAVAKMVQVRTAAANASTVSATLSPAAKPNHLLVVVCAARTKSAFTTPTEFSVAKSELTTAPVQAVYYKVAVGGETSFSCAGGRKARRGIQLYEYSGTATTLPLEAVNATSATGSTASASTGSVTTTSASTLVLGAIVARSSGTGASAWSNSFTERADFKKTARFVAADRYPTASGAYSSTATMSVASSWRGQIAAFKLLPITLSADIVNASNVSVASPSVAFPAKGFDFACQTSAATLGVPTQQLRVVNTTANTLWTLSIGATNGPAAVWSDGGTNAYDYNDTTSGGCADGSDADGAAGSLTVDPSAATITPDVSCSQTGVTRGGIATFAEGVVDSITLATGTAASETNCMWNITGIGLSQQIPPEPSAAAYNLGLTITLIAN